MSDNCVAVGKTLFFNVLHSAYSHVGKPNCHCAIVVFAECFPWDAQEVTIVLSFNLSLNLDDEFMVHSLANIKENHEHALGCLPDLTHTLCSRTLLALPPQRLLFGLWVIAVDLTLIKSDDPRHEGWVILSLLLTDSNLELLLLWSQEISFGYVPAVTKMCVAQDQTIRWWNLKYLLTKDKACSSYMRITTQRSVYATGTYNFLIVPRRD